MKLKIGKKPLLFFALFIATLSCKNDENREAVQVKAIPIDPAKSKEMLISDLFQSVDFIPITSESPILVHDIAKVREIGDTIGVMTGQELWLVDRKGKVINRIEAKGQGPGEYETINDLLVDKENQTIEILDGGSGKIIKYSLDGEFVEEWKNEAFHTARSFSRISEDIYAIYGGISFEMDAGSRLLYVSKSGDEITAKYFPIGKEARFAVFLEQDNFWRQGKDLHFSFTFQDTVYRLGEQGPEPYLGFDYGEYSLPDDIMERDFSDVIDFIEYCRQTPAAYQAANIFETVDRLFFTFEYQAHRHQGYYDNVIDELQIASGWTDSGGNKAMDELYYFLKYPKGSGDDVLYFQIEPYHMILRYDKLREEMTAAEWENLLQEHQSLSKLYQSLSKDDNNILVRAKLD